MTQPINLNKARKARAKSEKKARAAENVAKHGMSKADRTAQAKARDAEVTRLDSHKRER